MEKGDFGMGKGIWEPTKDLGWKKNNLRWEKGGFGFKKRKIWAELNLPGGVGVWGCLEQGQDHFWGSFLGFWSIFLGFGSSFMGFRVFWGGFEGF